jgi:hypothetical protein
MNAKIQAELDKLKELIVNAVPVEQIFLFGTALVLTLILTF